MVCKSNPPAQCQEIEAHVVGSRSGSTPLEVILLSYAMRWILHHGKKINFHSPSLHARAQLLPKGRLLSVPASIEAQ
jgi:hypothetical protein